MAVKHAVKLNLLAIRLLTECKTYLTVQRSICDQHQVREKDYRSNAKRKDASTSVL